MKSSWTCKLLFTKTTFFYFTFRLTSTFNEVLSRLRRLWSFDLFYLPTYLLIKDVVKFIVSLPFIKPFCVNSKESFLALMTITLRTHSYLPRKISAFISLFSYRLLLWCLRPKLLEVLIIFDSIGLHKLGSRSLFFIASNLYVYKWGILGKYELRRVVVMVFFFNLRKNEIRWLAVPHSAYVLFKLPDSVFVGL